MTVAYHHGVLLTVLLSSAIATPAIPINPIPQANPAARTGVRLRQSRQPKRFSSWPPTSGAIIGATASDMPS